MSLSLFYLTFLECGYCKHPYFIGEVGALFSVGTFTNICNTSLLDKRLNSNTYKTYLQQIVAIKKKDITVKINYVQSLSSVILTCWEAFHWSFSFLLSIASSVRRQWTLFIFSYQSSCWQVDMLAFSYLFRVMIKTLRFPRILFVSDAAHFWYVTALKIGLIGGCFCYFSYSRIFFVSQRLVTYFFIYLPMFCFTVFKANGEGSVSRL